MRILQVNAFFEPVGGAEVYQRLLASALEERGHALALFAGSATAEIDERDTRVLRRPEFDAPNLISDPRVSQAFLGLAGRFAPDLVHVHNVWTFPADFAAAIGGLGVPVVQTVHDFNAVCPNSWCVLPNGDPCPGGAGARCFAHGCQANYPYDARVVAASLVRQRLLSRSFDAFLCPSRFLATTLEHNGFRNVEHVPHYVEARSPPGGAPDPDRLLFAGRLVREKGVEVLLRALPEVRALHPAARLDVAGEGPLEADLKRLARELGVERAVTFRGRLPRPAVAAAMERACALVVPSIWCENAPLGCYEALSCGLPVVASRIGGLPDLVEDERTGLLFRPRDERDLAQKLARLLREPPLRARLSAGAAALAAELTRERHVARVEAIYAAVRKRGHRPADGAGGLDPDLLVTLDAVLRESARLSAWAHRLERNRGLLARLASKARARLRAWLRRPPRA